MTKFLLHLTERGYISDFLVKKAALFFERLHETGDDSVVVPIVGWCGERRGPESHVNAVDICQRSLKRNSDVFARYRL